MLSMGVLIAILLCNAKLLLIVQLMFDTGYILTVMGLCDARPSLTVVMIYDLRELDHTFCMVHTTQGLGRNYTKISIII